MTYKLPKNLPGSLTLGAKTFSLVTPKVSTTRGVCVGNDGSWFYYFPKAVVDDATQPNIGHRRHFSVRNAAGRRAVHISMKPSTGKPDDIMIWYRYDKQWTGKVDEPAGWGRIDPYKGQNAGRVAKAVALLKQFLEAMTAEAEGKSTAKPVQPCLSPPIWTASSSSSGGAWDEDFPPPVPRDTTPPSSPSASPVQPRIQLPVLDSWEDWEDDDGK
jgi:hypothetical protein